MVGRSPVLNSLKKGILPQIHHPLPLNRRESQNLLNALTTSFRKNLDKEHPWPAQETIDPRNAVTRDQALVAAQDATPRQLPTDHLLNSILSNPLFARPRHPLQSQASAHNENPFAVFDSAVSKGLMTPRRAAGFLATVRQQQELLASEGSPSQSHYEPAVASSAALRVIQWLRASGLESDLSFLAERPLVSLLVRFAFSGGLNEVIWTWLSRLGAQVKKAPDNVEVKEKLGYLLNAIMHTTKHAIDFESPPLPNDPLYSAFLRAIQTLPTDNAIVEKKMRHEWSRLSWLSTMDKLQRPKPSAPLYDLFVDYGRPWDQSLDIAHLELRHPVHPDPTSAVKFLHDDTKIATEMKRLKLGSKRNTDMLSLRIVSFGVDTVNRLKEMGEKDEASWVSEFMSRTFFAWNVRDGNLLGRVT